MNAGDVISDRFVIVRYAARGGMGEVYRADDRLSDEPVAVKIVAAGDAASLHRFQREARALGQLCHPGIVQYLAHGRAPTGDLFLAMEWLEGEDLASRLAASELTFGEALQVATAVAAALAATHARGIIHRDLKPSNLFLVNWQAAQIKILDFGLARLGRADRVTETGVVLGTPGYMAPEQVAGRKDVDARADVFALGAVLYRCLAGQPAFSGESAAELLARILHDMPPSLREIVPGIPHGLDALVARMLAKDPAQRPRDAGAVLGELMMMDELNATRDSGARPEFSLVESRVYSAVVADDRDGCRQVAQAHGARCVEGGGRGRIVALFEAQMASDLARQAARCALAMRDQARGATIAVVTGRGHARGGAPATLVERSVSLIGLAGEEAIRIDAATAGLLDSRFEVVGDAHGLILAGERDADEAPRLLLGKATPFVGRDRELALLEAVCAECTGERMARPVLVVAAAGAGKSRLRQELVRRLRALGSATVWTGRGDPMRAGAPFALVGDALRCAAGITGSEPLESRRLALRERVACHLAPGRLQATVDILGELAGVPFAAADNAQLRAARRDPVLFADLARTAWEDLLGCECDAQPVVLIFEDLHWGDLPSLRLIDAALRALAERPLMVLGLARPEVHAHFPRLWAERGLQEVNLGPLPRRASERLVAAVLGGITPEAMAAIVDGARGHAFFLEEIIRQAASGRGGDLPETVLAMVGSRLEALDPEERRALRAASVFGETFWSGGVGALLRGTQAGVMRDELLGRLVDGEVIRKRERARFADEVEYAFVHALVRDAAYLMLTDEDRAVGHQIAGAWLERAGETDAAVLADHFERGGASERAAGWYARAADQALCGSDLAAAMRWAGRAEACGARGVDLGALRLLQASVHRFRGDNVAAGRMSLAAIDDLPRGGDAWHLAVGEAAAAAGKLDDLALLRRLVDELLAVPAAGELGSAAAVGLARTATQCFASSEPEAGHALVARAQAAGGELDRDPGARAWIEGALVFADYWAGRHEHAVRHQLAAHDLFAQAGDARNACSARLELSYILPELGAHDEAEARLRPAIADGERIGLHSGVAMAKGLLARSLAETGRLDEALALATEAVEQHPDLTHPRIASITNYCLGAVHHGRGDLEAAEPVLRKALVASPTRNVALGWLALVRIERGDAAEALALVAPAVARLDPARGVVPHQMVLRLAMVEALLALDRLDEARAQLAAARDNLRVGLAAIESPGYRQGYVERVMHHRRLFALARQHLPAET